MFEERDVAAPDCHYAGPRPVVPVGDDCGHADAPAVLDCRPVREHVGAGQRCRLLDANPEAVGPGREAVRACHREVDGDGFGDDFPSAGGARPVGNRHTVAGNSQVVGARRPADVLDGDICDERLTGDEAAVGCGAVPVWTADPQSVGPRVRERVRKLCREVAKGLVVPALAPHLRAVGRLGVPPCCVGDAAPASGFDGSDERPLADLTTPAVQPLKDRL